MLVKHLMTPDPICISPDKAVADAVELMTERKFRHLLVMDEGKLVGLLTRSSLAQALPGLSTGLTRFEHNYLSTNTMIRNVTIKEPVTCGEDMAAEEAALIMNVNRISSLVVMSGDVPVGIITDTDIFEAMVELLGAKRRGVRATLHLVNRPGALARVTQIIFGAGGNISTVGMWDVDEDTAGTVMKIENLSIPQVQEVLDDIDGITIMDLRG